jgi:hypothetical protein
VLREGEWAPLDEESLRGVAVRLRWTALCTALALGISIAIASWIAGNQGPAREEPEAVVARYTARTADSIRCGELYGTVARCTWWSGSVRCMAFVDVRSASGAIGRLDCS